MIIQSERKHDLEGRDMLRAICNGKGLDIGCADRPIKKGVLTLDHNPDYNPDILADMKDIPVSDNTFDFLIASHILEHNDNTIDTLKEWLRILKVDGKIGIMVPHGEFAEIKDLGDSSMTHRTLLTEKTLEIYLKHIGFRQVTVNRIERPLAYKQTPAIIAFGVK